MHIPSSTNIDPEDSPSLEGIDLPNLYLAGSMEVGWRVNVQRTNTENVGTILVLNLRCPTRLEKSKIVIFK